MEHIPKHSFMIEGMTCASCETFIERRLAKIPGVDSVTADHRTGKTVIAGGRPTEEQINKALSGSDYAIGQSIQKSQIGSRRWMEIGGIGIIALAILVLMNAAGSLSLDITSATTMSYGFVFVIGLIASVSSCIAVTGGLLLGVSARYREAHPETIGFKRFAPHVYFNAGRVISYTVLGGAIGALGSLITLSPLASGVITIVASLVMIALGFQLLGILGLTKRLGLRMPKAITHRIHALSESDSPLAPFALGSATFFLPCGFTQALQFYVLSQGDPLVGALTMLVFSLGTMPALLSLGAVTSFVKGRVKRFVFRTAGVVVLVLGLVGMKSGLALAGVTSAVSQLVTNVVSSEQDNGSVPIQGGVQVADMRVAGFEYYPSTFTITAGVPVEWRIDGRNAAGCAQIITIPKLRLTKWLSKSETTVIRFTPEESGRLDFSCSMGMTTPGAHFAVIGDSGGNGTNSGTLPSKEDFTKCDPTRAMCLY